MVEAWVFGVPVLVLVVFFAVRLSRCVLIPSDDCRRFCTKVGFGSI